MFVVSYAVEPFNKVVHFRKKNFKFFVPTKTFQLISVDKFFKICQKYIKLEDTDDLLRCLLELVEKVKPFGRI